MKFKQYKKCKGFFIAEDYYWFFDDNLDSRIITAALNIKNEQSGSKRIFISHNSEDGEGYRIYIRENSVDIIGDSPAGAFYALMTLKVLILENDGNLDCCEIYDYPDMKIRGFYQDTTRGRIPTLETLKKLVDTMAESKLNMLQLYVEHSFDFKEYDFCKRDLGYLTTEEIKALDSYCKDRFIDLVPSLSCFGHLYHLLQSDEYKHLCELSDYEPQCHHFRERMLHHTINPLITESYDLITSLIAQHMAAFTSEYFNICCDETFDLGKDINKDYDRAELYTNFVTKLIKYVECKGKKVMMWADIVLEHPESANKLPGSIIYLNWDYSREPKEENIKKLANKNQIICPGTWSWIGFSERIGISNNNIPKLAKLGYKHNAVGMLNTNWGDMGNLASIDMAMYGLFLGAVASWDKTFFDIVDFENTIAKYYYGTPYAITALKFFDKILPLSNWTSLMANTLDENNTYELYEKNIDEISLIIKKLQSEKFTNEKLKNDFIIAAQGYSLLMSWCANSQGFDIKSNVDFDEWIHSYEKAWLRDSKHSEISSLKKLFIEFNSHSN